MWEYLHQGGGRRIHQENVEILSSREPDAFVNPTTDFSSYCVGHSDTNQSRRSVIEDDSQRSPAVSSAAITGAAGGAPKVRIGRRLADLFIQSGQADVSSFRQWITGKTELREELEALLYSKKWKELVEEAIDLVAEDFRLLGWIEIMDLNEKYVVYPDSQFYDVDTSIYWLKQILSFNGIELDYFIKCVVSVMDKSEMKLNSIWLSGPTNAGKSLICNSVVESARFYANIMEFDERTQFPLNDAPGKRVLLINEPVIADKRIELIKNIMEGQDVAINVKHRKGITLPRTPIIISSNKDLWHYCPSEQEAILNRCHHFKCNTMDKLFDCTKKLHPLLWKTIIDYNNPNDLYYSHMSTVCMHRNWKTNFFSKLAGIESLFENNAAVLSDTYDTVHLSLKPSCKMCILSEELKFIIDPPSDVQDCVSCGAKTVYLFCSKCIHVLN